MEPSHASPRSSTNRAATQRAERDLFCELLSYALHSLSRLGVPEADRDELAQETMIAAFKKVDEYDPKRASTNQWCRGFVVNVVRNYGRKNRIITGPVEELTPELVDDTPGPEERCIAMAHHELLHNVLLPKVSFEARVVLIAHDLDELSFKAIAEQDNLPLSTVHDRYQRGRKQLQAAYEAHVRQRKAQGLLVLPFTLNQLLAADRTIPTLPPDVVDRTWSRVEHALGWRVRLSALRPPSQRPDLVLVPTFLMGATVGAILLSLLRPSPPAIIVQPEPAKSTPLGVLSTAASSAPPATVAVLAAPPTSNAPGRDFNDAKRDFEVALQAFKHGRDNAASEALAVFERHYPADAFAGERKSLRARIAERRAADEAKLMNAKPVAMGDYQVR